MTDKQRAFIHAHPEMTHKEISDAFAGAVSRKTVESYRRRLAKRGGVPVEPKVDVVPLSREDQLADLEIRMRQQQLHKMEQTELQEQARTNAFYRAMSKVVGKLNFVDSGRTFQAAEKYSTDSDSDVAVMVISDWHFGKKTATYNSHVAQKRFAAYCERVMEEAEIRRKSGNDVRVLYMMFVGDLVDGHGIYKTQQAHIDAHVMEQIFDNAPFVVQQLAILARYFDRIEIHSVPGNHGRLDKVVHESANWDTFFMRVLELACHDIPNITWNVYDTWKALVNVEGRSRWLLYHGHQVKMQLNLPWYGITTRISRWAASSLETFDVAAQGHFHSSSSFKWNSVRVFTNGTAVSDDEFALEFIGLESSCEQWLVFINVEGSISAEVSVALSDV